MPTTAELGIRSSLRALAQRQAVLGAQDVHGRAQPIGLGGGRVRFDLGGHQIVGQRRHFLLRRRLRPDRHRQPGEPGVAVRLVAPPRVLGRELPIELPRRQAPEEIRSEPDLPRLEVEGMPVIPAVSALG